MRLAPPRSQQQQQESLDELHVRSLVALFDRQVHLDSLERRSSLKPQHRRAAVLMGVRAVRARIPASRLRTPALNPGQWWSEQEVEKGDLPAAKDTKAETADVVSLSEEELPIALLNGARIKIVRRVLFRRSTSKRFKEFLAVDEEGNTLPYNDILPDLLPLYRVEDIMEQGDIDEVTVVEGTGSADRLCERGVNAVGTMTGAFRAPSVSALQPLLRAGTVYLWPDNDAVGARHMDLIASRLDAMGQDDIRVVRWREGPRKGDAADFDGDDGELRKLYESARGWSREERVIGGSVLTVLPRHRIETRLQLSEGLRPPTPRIEGGFSG